MLFSFQNQVQSISSTAILSGTSANAVVCKGTITLFYTGVPSATQTDHGLWYSLSTDGQQWTAPSSIQSTSSTTSNPAVSVMAGTSASAVVSPSDGLLYLFYTSANKDGIWYTTSDGVSTSNGFVWTPIQSVATSIQQQFPNKTQMAVMTGTSPSVVAWNGLLYVFYTGAGEDGIWYTTSSDGTSWSSVQSIAQLIKQQFPGSEPIGVMNGTSPNAVVWNNQLCLLYTGQNNGIQYTTTTDGLLWSQVQSIQEKAPGMAVQGGSSTSALIFLNKLHVFYTSSGGDGLWYTTTGDGLEWSDVTPVDKNSGIQRGASGTSPWALAYENLLFVFWYGADPATQGLWLYRTIVEVDTSLFYLNGNAFWSWATSTSTALPFVGPLRLSELSTRDEFVFNLNPSVLGMFTTVDLSLNSSNGSRGSARTVFIPSGFQTTVTLILGGASIDVAVTGGNGTFRLAFVNDKQIASGYYVSVVIKVLANSIEHISPDPQVVLRPTTPITELNPFSKSRR